MKLHSIALLAGIAAAVALPGALQAGPVNSAIRSTVSSDISQPDFELVAARKYKRLKPGCRAAFCKPGYDYGNYKRYKRRRDFGRAVVGTIVIGAVIATAANAAPPRPSSDLCWVWANKARTRGYWDYCY